MIEAREVRQEEREQALKELGIYGYCQVPGYWSQSAMQELRESVESHHAAAQGAYQGVPERDDQDKILYNLQNKDVRFIEAISCEFADWLLRQKLNDPYYRFLPEDVSNYTLSYFNARSSGRELAYHIDSYIPVPGSRTWSMQMTVVLEDQDESNGCTVVVPGSHLTGEFSDRSIERSVPLKARAGDLLAWDSRLWHGTGPNHLGRSRWLAIASFCMWWVKPKMDIPRGLPQSIYEQLTDAQKALLGFCSIPPKHESQRINTKCGYESLLPRVSDYF